MRNSVVLLAGMALVLTAGLAQADIVQGQRRRDARAENARIQALEMRARETQFMAALVADKHDCDAFRIINPHDLSGAGQGIETWNAYCKNGRSFSVVIRKQLDSNDIPRPFSIVGITQIK